MVSELFYFFANFHEILSSGLFEIFLQKHPVSIFQAIEYALNLTGFFWQVLYWRRYFF